MCIQLARNDLYNLTTTQVAIEVQKWKDDCAARKQVLTEAQKEMVEEMSLKSYDVVFKAWYFNRRQKVKKDENPNKTAIERANRAKARLNNLRSSRIKALQSTKAKEQLAAVEKERLVTHAHIHPAQHKSNPFCLW